MPSWREAVKPQIPTDTLVGTDGPTSPTVGPVGGEKITAANTSAARHGRRTKPLPDVSAQRLKNRPLGFRAINPAA
jgi:hypothetical protein